MDSVLPTVLLLNLAVMLCGALGSGEPGIQRTLSRQRRDWVVPAKKLKENQDYTKSVVAQIRSDTDKQETMYYTLLGHGASKDPINVFYVEENTGLVYLRKILDREEKDVYVLTGVARFRNGTVAEGEINLKMEVEDENDNSPIFLPTPTARVNESSPPGTLVAQVRATDADQLDCPHSKIAYSIEKQEPSDGSNHFSINKDNGNIYVKDATLDRERVSSYVLTIKGTDMYGAPGGNTGNTTVDVKVVDINDNKPTLDKDEYSASIKENSAHVEVMRFTVLDDDEKNTDNWLSKFDIISGNEDGIFSIKTDPNTNEGVLMLEKPVDFEENPDIKLGVVVSNVAPPAGGGGGGGGDGGGDGEEDGGGGGGDGGEDGEEVGGGGGGGTGGRPGTGGGGSTSSIKKPKKVKSYPVNIAVQNEPEGVSFRPKVKPVSVSENPEENALLKVIAAYPAMDTDSGKLAENVEYAKGYDPDNWLSIDPETAEIRLNKVPDRESPFVVNGTYYAKILCMTQDVPSKMATGTIALQVGDANDNCPELTSNLEYLCSDTEVVNITAVDEDGDPNGAPLLFSLLDEKSAGEWELKTLDETSASLRTLRGLWPGQTEVSLIIRDLQGIACPEPQRLLLHVCTCDESRTCGAAGKEASAAALKQTSSVLGTGGIAALILGILALLFVGLLLTTCSCGGVPGTFTELPFDTREHLIPYHTEGQGEDREVPLLSSAPLHATMPARQTSNMVVKATPKMTTPNVPLSMACMYNARPENIDMGDGFGGFYNEEMYEREMSSMAMEEQSLHCEGIALPDVFLYDYYSQKASCGPECQVVKDGLLVYNYEGQGSPAGSVGCCSLLESDNDLQFLNDLGTKFKTLAEMCSPEPETEIIKSKLIKTEIKVNRIEQIARPTLESKQVVINNQSVDRKNVDISQSSIVSHARFNQSSICNNISQSSKSTSSIAQSPPINPVTTVAMAMLPPPCQTVLLQQQPVYYTTTPVLQPMHYIVQPQLQNNALLVEGSAAADLQGMILVSGSPGHTEHIANQGHTTGMFTFPNTMIEGVERVVCVEENRGGGSRVRSDGLGQCTVDRGMNVVMGGGLDGQRVLIGGLHTSMGTLSGAQSTMLTGEQVTLGQVGSELGFSEQVRQVGLIEGGQHIMVQSPTNLGSVSFSPTSLGSFSLSRTSLGSGVLSPVSLGPGPLSPVSLVASAARSGSVSGSMQPAAGRRNMVLVERQVNNAQGRPEQVHKTAANGTRIKMSSQAILE
ncbi:desmoglein-2.1-like [Polymixia lowei]